MGLYVFRLPDIGEGTAEAEIVEWHVKVGDAIEEDQTLVDVMTDKATVDITSPINGVVTPRKWKRLPKLPRVRSLFAKMKTVLSKSLIPESPSR